MNDNLSLSGSTGGSTGGSTSASLIRRVQHHDQDAWQALTTLYGPLVFHWCRRLGLRGEDAADLFQEVFVAVAKAIHRFEPSTNAHSSKGSFRGWLWTITRNKALDHHRYHKGRAAAAGGTATLNQLAEVADPFDDESLPPTDHSETTSLFHRALEMIKSEFEARTWQAFWRAAVDEHPTATIAEDLGLSQASVRQAKSRVLRRLRQVLGDA